MVSNNFIFPLPCEESSLIYPPEQQTVISKFQLYYDFHTPIMLLYQTDMFRCLCLRHLQDGSFFKQ